MKKKFILVALLPLAVACSHSDGGGKSKVEKDKAKLEALKKEEGELRTKMQALQDTINAEGGKELKTVKVVAQDITTKPFKHFVEVQASVYGQDNINVSPEIPGVVRSISVTEGDKVTKGQLLATIDDAVIQQNIQEVQTSLELTKTLYDKQKSLWDQKIGTEVQYLNAKSNYESMQKRLAALQDQADMARIKSPIDGTVDAVNVKIGESVAPGMPTIKVVNTDELKVKGNVAEAFIADIHQGDSLSINFPDLHQDITSTASYVSHAIDEVNRTFTVEVKLPQNANYHPNMIALMRIVDYSSKAAVVIPINIVQSDPTGTFVFIAENSNGTIVAKKQLVTVGKVYNGNAEITDGLKAGDKLITIGYEDLNNGDALSM
jgi:RND family efflux transporter MFP subunit